MRQKIGKGTRLGLSGIENAVRETENMSAEQTVLTLLHKVDDFAAGVEQADDITILALEFLGLAWDELLVSADDAHLESLLAFWKKNCGQPSALKDLPLLLVAAEEVLTNIAHYAYAPEQGTVKLLRCRVRPMPFQVVLQFQDSGRPFNPLHKPGPDITLPAEKRDEGGLGIAMVAES